MSHPDLSIAQAKLAWLEGMILDFSEGNVGEHTLEGILMLVREIQVHLAERH